ncbi:polysaccharide pyruvyl transferase family protein [Lachnospiraceae bacterium LCP25S3_G4]
MNHAIIITFHCAPNYGALLQTYAMQTIFSNYFSTVEILDYRPTSLLESYRYFQLTSIRTFLSSLLNIPAKYIKYNNFKNFSKLHLHLTPNTYYDSNDIALDCDFIILGSDQIWCFDITKGYDNTYFGNITKKTRTKIMAYAPSIGKDSLTDNECSLFKYGLTNIDYLSVRESSASELLYKITNRKPEVVLDPTLLLTDSQWQTVAQKTRYKNYVLLYSLNGYFATYRIARFVADKYGLDIIEILSGGISFLKKYKHKVLSHVSPDKFLGLMEGASYVVTDSFHGTAFAIKFQKNFYTVPHNISGSRVTHLLTTLHLDNRICNEFTPSMHVQHIDYQTCNKLLQEQIKQSYDFIDNSLKKERI